MKKRANCTINIPLCKWCGQTTAVCSVILIKWFLFYSPQHKFCASIGSFSEEWQCLSYVYTQLVLMSWKKYQKKKISALCTIPLMLFENCLAIIGSHVVQTHLRFIYFVKEIPNHSNLAAVLFWRFWYMYFLKLSVIWPSLLGLTRHSLFLLFVVLHAVMKTVSPESAC